MMDNFHSVIVFSSLFSVITSVLLISAIRIFNMRFAVKEYKSEPSIKGEMTYISSDEGIRLKCESSDAFFKWEEIQKAILVRDMFILYVTIMKAIVIPTRFFDSEEDIDLFKNIISENMDTTKIKF